MVLALDSIVNLIHIAGIATATIGKQKDKAMTAKTGWTAKDPRVGKRVEIAPHYDLWMRSARFGVITRVNNRLDRLAIRMDHPAVKRLAKIHAGDVTYR